MAESKSLDKRQRDDFSTFGSWQCSHDTPSERPNGQPITARQEDRHRFPRIARLAAQ